MRHRNRYLIATGILFFCSIAAQAADLSIEVSDFRNHQGNLMVAVFDSPAAYDALSTDRAYALYTVKVQRDSARLTIHNVPEGRYAISLFHDENSISDLDTNMLGIPTEGYGISNARHKYGRPQFDTAAVIVQRGTRHISVTMQYLGG